MQSNDVHRIADPQPVAGGGCLCGEVAFELDLFLLSEPDRALGVCDCLACRRWTGGGPVHYLVTVPERFRVLHGQELLAHYRDQSALIRTFCRRCGSSLYQDTGLAYLVSVGALDELELPLTVQVRLAEIALSTEPDVATDEVVHRPPFSHARLHRRI